MKTFFRYIIAASMLPVFFSCQEMETEDRQPDPIFPEKVTDFEVVAGEELEFTFTPNLAWELSLSEGSFQYFKLLEENGRQREKLSGKASESPITVKIWVNPLEEFDQNRSCVLTLAMGGQSQIVAEYMRPAKSRSLSVYTAKVQDGAYVTDDAGAYVYNETAAESVEVMWSDADAAFLLPIKVVANCQWDIDRTSFPSWLELNVPDNTEGIVELFLNGNSLEDASATVGFVSSGEVLAQMNVSIQSCVELGVYSAQYEQGDWLYEESGYAYTAEPQENLEMVWTGSDIRIPVMVDSKCEWTLEMPEWITAELDDKRAGQDHFVLKCDPQYYPLDDTDVTILFKYAGQTIKTMSLSVPGCREIISYVMGMSMSSVEFNYTGQYKTSSGYMDAPINGHVTAPSSMSMRIVEIVGGTFTQAVPEWLQCEVEVDADTDTKMVLQTKTLKISVTQNTTQNQRHAYIFFLPRAVEDISELFQNDKCTVKGEYTSYVLPVVQAPAPAGYLTPELTATEMAVEGAYLVKSEKSELYECFGVTEDVYELTYENTWSSDVAKMYLTSPYKTIEYYDADKQPVADQKNFWITFTDYMENKTFGAVVIPIAKEGENGEWEDVVPVAGVSYVVFKDEQGAVLCVIEFTYAPKVVEPEPEPEPSVGSEDVVVDASQYFADPEAASSVGATLVEILEVKVPAVTSSSTQEEKDLAAYKKSLTTTFNECKNKQAPLYRLTYTQEDTELILNFVERLANTAVMFTVNPYRAQSVITINGNTMDDDGGHLIPYESTDPFNGMPAIKMKSFSSLDADLLNTQPIKILFYDSESNILLGIECVLK